MDLIKRLRKDLQTYHASPLIGSAVQPREDDFTVWDCWLMLYFPSQKKSAPIHIVVQYPSAYPVQAPKVGFGVQFPYRNGAGSVVSEKGPLYGKFAICLDILGNFETYHIEWQSTTGSGWSPAYTITSLLVNLQSVFMDTITESHESENIEFYDHLIKYLKDQDNVPEINMDENISYDQQPPIEELLVALPTDLKDLCDKFYKSLSVESQRNDFLQIMEKINSLKLKSNDVMATNPPLNEKVMNKVDTSISCWYTGYNYTEEILGYGVVIQSVGIEKFNITTDGNLISLQAFQGGLRQFPTKEVFDEFIPAWINVDHARNNPDWVEAIKASSQRIGQTLHCADFVDAFRRIFPDLINTMVCSMMDITSDKMASEKIFQCILNIWRVFYYTSTVFPDFRSKALKDLNSFTKDSNCRRKGTSPNIGWTLATSSIFSSDELDLSRFMVSYESEGGLRRVMWWQKAGLAITPADTFEKSAISRKNLLFQLLFRKIAIGMTNQEMNDTLQTMEMTNCQCPEQLNKLLVEWKEQERRSMETPTWEQYYTDLTKYGFPIEEANRINANIQGQLDKNVAMANILEGYHYTASINNNYNRGGVTRGRNNERRGRNYN